MFWKVKLPMFSSGELTIFQSLKSSFFKFKFNSKFQLSKEKCQIVFFVAKCFTSLLHICSSSLKPTVVPRVTLRCSNRAWGYKINLHDKEYECFNLPSHGKAIYLDTVIPIFPKGPTNFLRKLSKETLLSYQTLFSVKETTTPYSLDSFT